MHPSEMIKGKVYYIPYDKGWIIRFSRMDIEGNQPERIMDSSYMSLEDDGTSKNFWKAREGQDGGWGEWNQAEGMREATYEEICWLEACEKAGEAVPKPEISHYSIY